MDEKPDQDARVQGQRSDEDHRLKARDAIGDILHRLERFGVEVRLFREEISVLVAPLQLQDVARTLRDEFKFDFLSSLTASDYWPQLEPRFHVVYQLYSHPYNIRLCLRVPVNDSDPVVPTVETVWPVANWHEREVFDMFGIRFEGHSDLRRILMPHDWEGYPLRKDYPLGYEEPQFTFNFEDIQIRKHRPTYEEA